jgi:prepilin-type N-terminal cleavage/methylation domain-containing protein
MRRSRIKRGFTLIELAAASAATAILMGAVLAILGGITRDRERLAQARPSERTDQAPVIELLRRDLACASDLQVESNGDLVLDADASLDAKNL